MPFAPRPRGRLRIALDMRPPRALPAAHFDRNERYAYFGDSTLNCEWPVQRRKTNDPGGPFPGYRTLLCRDSPEGEGTRSEAFSGCEIIDPAGFSCAALGLFLYRAISRDTYPKRFGDRGQAVQPANPAAALDRSKAMDRLCFASSTLR